MSQPPTFIRLSTVRHVGWLEFNRPPVNAFTREMVEEVHDGIAAALADPDVRVLVLASAVDGYFSAGADLNVFKGMKARRHARLGDALPRDRAAAARARPSRCWRRSTAPRSAAGWR